MPLNKKTGKSDRHTLTPGDLFKYRVGLLKNKKGKQRALEQQEKPEASGSGASPSTMLNALTLGSGSSYPNSAAASQSPLSATAPQSAAPSPATEAPAPTAFNPPAAASQSAAPSPATAAYSPPAFDPLAPATATQAPAISAATNLPAATAADPPVPATAADPSIAAAADPTLALAPILLQHFVPPERRYAPFIVVPPRQSTSSQQPSHADLLRRARERDLELSNQLSSVVMSLGEWGREIEEWKHKAEELKRQVDARLQGGGL